MAYFFELIGLRARPGTQTVPLFPVRSWRSGLAVVLGIVIAGGLHHLIG